MRAPSPVVPFTEDGARMLGRQYWLAVARAGRGIVRCRETEHRVELTALGVGPVFLRFGGAEIAITSDAVSCAYNVQGGLLSLGEGGTLAISQIGREHPELRVLVDGYLARLGGGVLYSLQRRAHVAVSRRFFRHLLAEAARR